MWASLIGLFLGKNPLSRVLDTIDAKMDNETEREKARTTAVNTYIQAQASTLTGPGWWFPVFFIIPLGVWFSSIIIYSMFFCQRCIWPQPWSIAALPPPLDEWSGVIVSSLFIGGFGSKILVGWRK